MNHHRRAPNYQRCPDSSINDVLNPDTLRSTERGGFNWSSQHLNLKVLDNSAAAHLRPGGAPEVEVARSSEIPAAERRLVLGRDRERNCCLSRRRRSSRCHSQSDSVGSITLAGWR